MTCSSLFSVLVPQSPSYGRQGELKRGSSSKYGRCDAFTTGFWELTLKATED
jgi:hypothetical protein